MARFICKNCNYRFESGKEGMQKKCPYCGKGAVIKEQDAEELLDEIGED